MDVVTLMMQESAVNQVYTLYRAILQLILRLISIIKRCPLLETVQCDDGDIRLLTGEIMGPLEVCVSKRWATVCSYGWSNVDAIVACREMGFDSGKSVKCTVCFKY